MTERLKKLCAFLEGCDTFIDVGCDHGYCTQYMLESGLCRRAVIADISAKSLAKAQRLLKRYIAEGVCTPVCCDGLEGVRCDGLTLIAGMGGEEIIHILSSAYIPQSFVFQPMKNAAELRAFLLGKGCRLQYDGLFTETRANTVKHYFVIKGFREGGGAPYTSAQLAWGRDSLGTPELKSLLEGELEKLGTYMRGGLSASSRMDVARRMDFIQGVLADEYD